MIISDAIFYNSGTMTVAQIQTFLNARVPTCRAGYVCLKDYRQTTTSQPARSEGCAAYAGQSPNEPPHRSSTRSRAPAASIRARSSYCSRRSRDSSPTPGRRSRQYRSATGYGCPDTADCDANYYGFFNQVYHASWQFKKYRARPADRAYQAGRYNTILWHPNSGCGTSQVYIQNQATAGLYLYTPYRPNAAALANLYGTGDACSSYGNRNFWRMFTDWFGSTSTIAVHPSLLDLYNSTGGAGGKLGVPVAAAELYSGGGVGQRFTRGWGYAHELTGAHRTGGAIGARYAALGGPTGPLWYPIGSEVVETGGASQAFQKGWLYWSAATGAQRVYGAIGSLYRASSGPAGPLGYPMADEQAQPGGSSQRFTKGWVYWSPATQAQRVTGGIGSAYVAAGGPASGLGYPLATEVSAAGGANQRFETGSMYWSSTTRARVVIGGIDVAYRQLGAGAGRLGYPVEDTVRYADGGLGQRFQHGWLFWSASAGAHPVIGGIATKYLATGGATSRLGYPLAGELAEPGGASQRFSGGSIYWSSATSAQRVFGAIGALYISSQGPAGPLGYPATDELAEPGGASQRYTRGWVYWSAATGAQRVAGAIGSAYVVAGGARSALGFPAGPEVVETGGANQPFQKGWYMWSSPTKAHSVATQIGEFYYASGGAATFGYPIADTVRKSDGSLEQSFQKGGIRWTASGGAVRF